MRKFTCSVSLKKSLKCKEVSLYGKKQKHDVFLKTALNHISVICRNASQLTYSLKLPDTFEKVFSMIILPLPNTIFWKAMGKK